MAKFAIVAGRATQQFISMIEGRGDMTVEYNYYFINDLIKDLRDTGGPHLLDLKAILVVDYGFKNIDTVNKEDSAGEFVTLQDLMRVKGLNKVKLYLVTKHSDLYTKLKGNVGGAPGTLFENVQILLLNSNSELKTKFIHSLLLGELDNTGLYNKNTVSKKSKEERLKEDLEMEIINRSTTKSTVKDLEEHVSTTEILEDEYVGEHTLKELEQRKREEERKIKRVKKREVRINKTSDNSSEEPESIKINIYKGNVIEREDDNNEGYGKELNKDEIQLKTLFSDLKKVRTEIAEGKIESDRGVISIIGDYSAGASGIVANAAEMYTMAHRKVLVIDLDIQNRMQTVYFKQYDKVVANQRGSSNSLIEVIQGYAIEDSVVPITKYLHVLSIGKEEEISLSIASTIEGFLERVLLEARRKYDIIILDIPFRLFERYLKVFKYVDRNIFVVENKFYKVENFFENLIHPILVSKGEYMEGLLTKSNIVLNKFKRGMRDYEGKEINRNYIKKMLEGIGYPYDTIGVLGEIPFYDDWENQFLTGLRYVWDNHKSLGVYRLVFGKVVIG